MKALPQLPTELLRAFQENEVFDASGKMVPLHSNISLSEAEVLYTVIRELKPTASAEVGFAQGISTMAVLKALEDNGSGLHHVIDPFQEKFQDVGLAMVKRAELNGRMQFYRKFAEEVLPNLSSLQFVFIDSSHLFDLTITEFVLADKKLDVDGVIAFHDLWMPSLRKVVRYILNNRSYSIFRPSSQIAEGISVNIRLKAMISGTLRRLPGSDRILREEILRPWSTFGVGNLMFLKKTGSDDRDWRFHTSF